MKRPPGIALFSAAASLSLGFSCAGPTKETTPPNTTPTQAPETLPRLAFLWDELQLGKVFDAEDRSLYLFSQSVALSSGEWPAVGAIELLPGDPRLVLLPTLPNAEGWRAMLSRGVLAGLTPQGAVVFVDSCGEVRAAPRWVADQALDPGFPLLLYRGTWSEDPGKLGPRERIPREEAEPMLPARRRIDATEETYRQRVELDGDPEPEYFLARAEFDLLGDRNASAVEIDAVLVDQKAGQWSALWSKHQTLSPEELENFQPRGAWWPWAGPPLLAADLDQDGQTELLRETPTGYALWTFSQGNFRPSPLHDEADCE